MNSWRTVVLIIILATCVSTATAGEPQSVPNVTAKQLIGVWELVS